MTSIVVARAGYPTDSLKFQPQHDVEQCSSISRAHPSCGAPSHFAEAAGQSDERWTMHVCVGRLCWHAAVACHSRSMAALIITFLIQKKGKNVTVLEFIRKRCQNVNCNQ